MKALIVNIDRNHRSVFTGLIASCLLSKIPSLQLTGLISGENGILKTTNHFQDLHFVDIEGFFHRTRGLPSPQVEKEIVKLIAPVRETKWDVVINLSSNLLGSIFINFLDYKEVKGPFLNNDLSGLKYSDIPSYFLARSPENLSCYLHFTYLYRSMLKRFEDIPLNSVWKPGVSDDLLKYFAELKSRHSSSGIIFIDTGIRKGRKVEEIDFLAVLYGHIREEGEFLPVLLGKELDDNDPLIRKLQGSVSGEVHAITCTNEAQLSVLGLGSLIITDDLYLKSIADLCMRPSILLSETLNLTDFSIIPGSIQAVIEGLDLDLSMLLASMSKHILHGDPLPQEKTKKVTLYKSASEDHLPVLIPVNSGGSPEYATWWLGLKYFARIQRLALPPVTINPKNYQDAIFRERQHSQKGPQGLQSFAQELASSDIGKKLFTDPRQALLSVENFFESEEKSL